MSDQMEVKKYFYIQFSTNEKGSVSYKGIIPKDYLLLVNDNNFLWDLTLRISFHQSLLTKYKSLLSKMLKVSDAIEKELKTQH